MFRDPTRVVHRLCTDASFPCMTGDKMYSSIGKAFHLTPLCFGLRNASLSTPLTCKPLLGDTPYQKCRLYLVMLPVDGRAVKLQTLQVPRRFSRGAVMILVLLTEGFNPTTLVIGLKPM